jgi:hypothetical protein
MGNVPIHFMGDSHMVYFKAAAESGLFGSRRFSFCVVPGATATGMRNPNSMSDALGRFRRSLGWTEKYALTVIQLGEVDCGFVMWLRAQRHGDSVASQMEASIAAYADFLREMIAGGHRRIVLTGATPPTIRDGAVIGDVADARREVTASQAERTALTVRYNARLKALAAELGLCWADATEDLIDPSTGLVADRFLNADAADHHLETQAAGRIWAKKLAPAIARHDGWSAKEIARWLLRRKRLWVSKLSYK